MDVFKCRVLLKSYQNLVDEQMSAVNSTKRYSQGYPTNFHDRIGYNNRYRSTTSSSFLDKYRPKTATYYSALQDINPR